LVTKEVSTNTEDDTQDMLSNCNAVMLEVSHRETGPNPDTSGKHSDSLAKAEVIMDITKD
jgi:hypothetical protein